MSEGRGEGGGQGYRDLRRSVSAGRDDFSKSEARRSLTVCSVLMWKTRWSPGRMTSGGMGSPSVVSVPVDLLCEEGGRGESSARLEFEKRDSALRIRRLEVTKT
jgi:hypothetical protein